MKKWIEHSGNAIQIAFGIMFFMIFMTIIDQGYIKMGEPNSWILYTELALAIGALIIGVYNAIDDAIRHFGKKK